MASPAGSEPKIDDDIFHVAVIGDQIDSRGPAARMCRIRHVGRCALALNASNIIVSNKSNHEPFSVFGGTGTNQPIVL